MTDAFYVYAIVGRGVTLPGSVSGDDLALLPCRDIGAVASQLKQSGAPPVTMEAVPRHESVVEAVRQQGPALPVRFGTVFRDAAAVTSALAERYDALVADLERIGDKVELCLTALWANAPADDASLSAHPENTDGESAGARYLLTRAAEARRHDAIEEHARALAEECDDVLGGLALEGRMTLVPTSGIAFRTAYLLERQDVAAFRMEFEQARRAQHELRILLTGPWAPYSFVSRANAQSERRTTVTS